MDKKSVAKATPFFYFSMSKDYEIKQYIKDMSYKLEN